jgi:hypothetical protein
VDTPIETGTPTPAKTTAPPSGEVGEGEFMQRPKRVYLPIHILPSVIPSYQRLLDAPYKWKLVVVRYWDGNIYYLTDFVDIIYIQRNEYEECMFYHRTKGGKVYEIKINRSELPKNLSQYVDHMFVKIDEEQLENKWRYTVRTLNPELKVVVDLPRNLVGIDDYHIFFINLFFKYISSVTTRS